LDCQGDTYAFPAPAALLPGGYEHGSLTAAAEQLGYAQPSVSEQIRSLEKSLGTTLFRRVGRGVGAHHRRRLTAPARGAAHRRRRGGAPRRAERVALETGTIRFGMFGTAGLYAGAGAGRRRARPAPRRSGSS
jgi:DNA-binding transcriptional LysR family regulator